MVFPANCAATDIDVNKAAESVALRETLTNASTVNASEVSTSAMSTSGMSAPQDSPFRDDLLLRSSPLQAKPFGGNTALMGGDQMMQVLAALFLILMLIAGAAWVIRRLNGGVSSANSLIRVLASYPMGPKQRLVVVEVNHICLLLGVGAEQVNCLHEFKKGEIEPDQIAANHFSQKLQEILSKGVFK